MTTLPHANTQPQPRSHSDRIAQERLSLAGPMPSGQAHVHGKDCGFDCLGAVMPLQSPIVVPLNRVKQPPRPAFYEAFAPFRDAGAAALQPEIQRFLNGEPGLAADAAGRLAHAATFYVGQLDPKQLEPQISPIVHALSRDRNITQLLSDPRVVGQLDRHLVEYFASPAVRRIEFDAEHRAFQFFSGLRKWVGLKRREPDAGGEPFNAFAELSENTDLRGVASRYIRRMLNTPEGFDDPAKGPLRTEIFSYLLPKLLELAASDKTIAQFAPEQREALHALQTRIGLTVAAAAGPDALGHLLDPDFYTVQTLERPSGRLVTHKKDMYDPAPGGYGHKTGIDVEAVPHDGAARNAPHIRYMGQDFSIRNMHLHIGADEHPFAENEQDANRLYARTAQGGPVPTTAEPGSVVGEMHIVTASTAGNGYLVLGTKIRLGRKNERVQQALDDFIRLQSGARPEHGSPDAPEISLLDFLPEGKVTADNVSYFGSLTTASNMTPTTAYQQGVRFVLPKEATVEVSAEQLDVLKQMSYMNIRAPQHLMGRSVIAAPGR